MLRWNAQCAVDEREGDGEWESRGGVQRAPPSRQQRAVHKEKLIG